MYPQLLNKLPETLHYIYDWLPEIFITVREVPPETINKLKIDHNNIEIQNHNAKNQPVFSQTFQRT